MSVVSLVERLERLDAASMGAAEIAAGLRDLARVRGFVSTVEHALARRTSELAAVGASAPADEVLGRTGRCSGREAAKTTRRADALADLPDVAEQLAKGRIGNEHADALAAALGRLDERQRAALLDLDTDLAQAAASSTPSSFKRKLDRIVDQLAADRGDDRAKRQRAAVSLSRGINDETGMYWLRAELDPISGATVFAALDAESRAQARLPEHADERREQVAAHALVDLITSTSRSRRPGRTDLLVLIDLDTLTGGLHERSTCESGDGTPLPVSALRQLACDANLIPAVLNGDGVPLDLGRSTRLANRDQRRALRAAYRTCAIDECEVPFDRCEVHHVDEWLVDVGPTDLDRLIPLCSRHHHRAHEGDWRLELDSTTRRLTVTLPDGSHHSTGFPDHRTDLQVDGHLDVGPPDRTPSHPVAAATARPAA